MRRKLFNVASFLSLLLCAATVVMADFSFRQAWSYPFPWRGGKYEIGLGAGRIWVANKPQLQAEDGERMQALDAAHVTLQRLPYGTPEYIAAKEGRRQIESQPRSAVVEHSLPLWAVLVVSLVLPALWLVVWIRRRPRFRRELWTPAGLVASLMLAVSLTIAGVWVWSYFGGDAWTFVPKAIEPPITNWHARSWRALSSVRMSVSVLPTPSTMGSTATA